MYAAIDFGIVLLTVALAWSAIRLLRWRRPLTQRRAWLTAAWAVLEIGVAVAVLATTPSNLQPGISWRTLLTFAPDIGWWSLSFAGVLLVTGLTRAALLMRSLRQSAVRGAEHVHKSRLAAA